MLQKQMLFSLDDLLILRFYVQDCRCMEFSNYDIANRSVKVSTLRRVQRLRQAHCVRYVTKALYRQRGTRREANQCDKTYKTL